MRSKSKVAGRLICLALAASSLLAVAAETTKTSDAAPPVPAASTKDHDINSAASGAIDRRRQKIIKEAVSADTAIVSAIEALDNKDSKAAFKDLELASGKLDVVLARDPKLKLAPINVRSGVVDLETTPTNVKRTVSDARTALDAGRVQVARDLLMSLVSEIRITTDYLPLEIYPAAIKLATKQIQASNLKAAEMTLAGAVSSVVSAEEVIPLAPIKAEFDIGAAQALYKKDHVKNKERVLALLAEADAHLASGTALGYGKYDNIQKEITALRSKITGGDTSPDLFDRVKKFFESLKP